MPWKRHRLRDAEVWAEVDAAGALLTDEAGRVAVLYKRDPAAKVYRAAGRNLGAIAGAGVEDLGAAPPSTAPAGAPSAADQAQGQGQRRRRGRAPG
jgi:hypothetical protein